MLNEKEIQRVADLARLSLTEAEIKKFKIELTSILDYIEALNTVPTEGVEPLYQTAGIINSTRGDTHRGDFAMDQELNEFLIGQAPHKQERFVKVKSVMKLEKSA